MTPFLYSVVTLTTILLGSDGFTHGRPERIITQSVSIQDIAFSEDDRCLYVAAGNHLKRVNLDGTKREQVLHKHGCAVKSIFVFSDGKYLTAWDANSKLFEFDLHKRRQVKEWGSDEDLWYLGKARSLSE